MTILRHLGTTIGSLMLLTSSYAYAAYTFIDLSEKVGGLLASTSVTSINNSSVVVGDWRPAAADVPSRPIVWGDGVVKNPFLPPNSTWGYLRDISNTGLIVGNLYTYSGRNTAALWQGNNLSFLKDPIGTYESVATAVNDSGQIAGIYNGSIPILWANATADPVILPLLSGHSAGIVNAINNSGQLVGNSSTGSVIQAVLWEDGNVVNLASSLSGRSIANDINDAGQILIQGQGGSYIWENGVLDALDNLGSGISVANGINNLGQVIGRTDFGDGYSYATLWNGSTPIDLNSQLDPEIVHAGWVLYSAVDINDSGWITALAHHPVSGTQVAVLLSPVPEPEAYVMLLAGLGLLGLRQRRKQGQ
ncbi:PEP-CTERM sorting domain-containing protein [Nitrosovibrio sp. Nv17]|uniref:PEP-CTERM sorting domain-containing protein n=1 Tax=Nitrosovibrio sp. Nv17 TaxID=1855339 RepID=UPI000908DA0A|nr:PEP-CTERM sorting domain-containing protein [Nitrosovibrio sp. Nv17]SFW40428.1 PEP-CTERM protein-sorting domain-containing protein/MYXO-CTERM domain-containing protein [Nitrosovibrio sp. Nv17]